MRQVQKTNVFVLSMFLLTVLLSANMAYAMGGGGGGGGGFVLQQPSGTGGGSQTGSGTQNGGGSSSDPGGSPGTPQDDPVSLPEPIVVLLIGSGLVGLAGLRRRFR